MLVTLPHANGIVAVEDLGTGKRLISVEVTNGNLHTWETSYPVELIESILKVKGPDHLCDEIMRDEDPSYVERSLRYTILGYVGEEGFAGKRLLDIGCGCGSSSARLATIFPQTEIVGVELVQEFLTVARQRARFYGRPNASFARSPEGDSLPDGIGSFDFVVLSAVYEHLLPRERRTLLPRIWSHLNPRGIMFINQLPYRFSPTETHTTSLPLINYLPDRWAYRTARRFSKRVGKDESWDDLLRRGIRGGTEREILAILNRASETDRAILLEPTRLGPGDRIDLWHAISSGARWPVIKKVLKGGFRVIKRTTGATVVPELSLAIQKERVG
jgi:2-polyprenyl-3-methyl-5-hydroxy-6-metoxy-1,4-benzoquinol methylase